MKLKNKQFFSSFFWVAIDKIGLIAIQFITIMILSRILSKSDFGIIGILTIFLSMSTIIIDSGMGGALIKKQRVRDIDYYTLFIYNLFTSIVLYAILFFCSGYLEIFYQINGLSRIIRVIGLVLIFQALGLIQNVRLTRALDFKMLAIITLITQITASTIAVITALKGWGVWALVLLTLVQSFFNTIALWIVNKFIPRFIFSTKSFKEQWAFGINLLFSNILNVTNLNVHSSVIGKIYTKELTGMYVQSSKLQNLPVGIITAIVDKATFPILSRMNIRQKREDIAIQISRVIYFLSFPLFAYMILTSKSLLHIFLGPQWVEGDWILSILALSGIPLVIKAMARNIIKSGGKTSFILHLEAFNCIFTLLLLFLTLSYGLETVLWGLVISNNISAILSILYLRRAFGISIIRQIKNIIPFLGIFILLIISGKILKTYLPIDNPYLELIIIGTVLFLIVGIVSLIARLNEAEFIKQSLLKLFSQ